MKKGVKPQKVTIEKLAIMMNNGFETLKKDISNIHKDVSDINTRITGVENKLEGTNKRIDDLAENRVKIVEHNKLKTRVTLIEEKI